MKPPTITPIPVIMYPVLAEECQKHGYALAVHGSVSRDFDIIAIPWTEEPSDPIILVDAVCDILNRCHLTVVRGQVTQKPHGRIAYGITVCDSGCSLFLDFCAMPPTDLLQYEF